VRNLWSWWCEHALVGCSRGRRTVETSSEFSRDLGWSCSAREDWHVWPTLSRCPTYRRHDEPCPLFLTEGLGAAGRARARKCFFDPRLAGPPIQKGNTGGKAQLGATSATSKDRVPPKLFTCRVDQWLFDQFARTTHRRVRTESPTLGSSWMRDSIGIVNTVLYVNPQVGATGAENIDTRIARVRCAERARGTRCPERQRWQLGTSCSSTIAQITTRRFPRYSASGAARETTRGSGDGAAVHRAANWNSFVGGRQGARFNRILVNYGNGDGGVHAQAREPQRGRRSLRIVRFRIHAISDEAKRA